MGQSLGHLPEHCVYKKKQHFSIPKISGSREVYFFAAKIYNCREKKWGLFSFCFLFWLVGFFWFGGGGCCCFWLVGWFGFLGFFCFFGSPPSAKCKLICREFCVEPSQQYTRLERKTKPWTNNWFSDLFLELCKWAEVGQNGTFWDCGGKSEVPGLWEFRVAGSVWVIGSNFLLP